MFSESLFLGVLSKPMREFIIKLIKIKSEQYNIFIDPTCGSFAIAECAVLAGIKNIECSDIGLYSSVIGYYISQKKIESLHVFINDKICNYPEKILFDYWIEKLNDKKYYDKWIYENIKYESFVHQDDIKSFLDSYRNKFSKINFKYEICDLSKKINNSKAILFIDPPGTKKNDYISKISWIGSNYIQTDIKEEQSKYLDLLKSDNPVIIRRFREVPENEQSYIVYAEYKKNKFDYLLSNIPIKTEFVNLNKPFKVNPGKYQLFSDSDFITKDSEIFIKTIKKEHALYYRDLFNKGMGSTQAERYFGFFIDGKLVGVSGFFTDFWLRRNENYVFETFGFSVRVEEYPRMNKLHMMILTSSETAQYIKATNSTINEQPEYFKTVCLTKNYEQKGNRGILKIVERKKMENGLFHILYETKFYKENWKDRMVQFLQKEKYNVTTGKRIQS